MRGRTIPNSALIYVLSNLEVIALYISHGSAGDSYPRSVKPTFAQSRTRTALDHGALTSIAPLEGLAVRMLEVRFFRGLHVREVPQCVPAGLTSGTVSERGKFGH